MKSKLLNGLTLNVLVLGVTSLLTDISSEMIFTLLPFFMVSVLGIQMTFVGVIEGAAETTASLLKGPSGWFSDRMKRRKPFAVLGYTLSAMLKPLFALATSAIHILTLRILDRAGKGVRTSPRDALIADSVQADVRGKAYGFHRSMDTLGAVVGPLIAFLLFPILWYRGVFLVSLIPSLIAVALLVILVKERGPSEASVETVETPSPPSGFKALTREFKIFVIIIFLFTLSNFSYAFFLLRAENLGVSVYYAPLLYLLFNVIYATFAFPTGMLADKIGKKLILSLGYVIFGLTCFGFTFASSPLHATILFIPYGLSFAITETIQRAYVPDFVSSELRGTAFGVLHATIGLAAFPASFIAGILWQVYSPSVPFLFATIIAFISAFLILAFVPVKPSLR